jgi:VWFA-related protein
VAALQKYAKSNLLSGLGETMLIAIRGDLMKSSVARLTVLFCLLSAIFLPQCNAQDNNKPVLKSNTRLVVVDVVVRDNKGEFVSDLTADDFKVLENGKPQKISGFTLQRAETSVVQTALHLPPNVVSNVSQRYASSLNVIVLDTLNGDFAGHAQAQDALIQYLGATQLTQPMAIFALQEKLVLLHDFTTDNEALKAVVKKFRPPARFNPADNAETRVTAFTVKGDFHTDNRNIDATLNALHSLARMLSNYTGRKNVIWLSESFPLVLAPETAVRDSISVANFDGLTRVGSQFDVVQQENPTQDYAGQVKKVADAMASAQVAVYPVDSTALTKDDHLASQHTMENLAVSTGGKAFYNRNDLLVELRTSLDDGASYYTLSYYPENRNWDGKFRTIAVANSRPGVKLHHRIGYYATDPDTAAKEEAKLVAEDFSRSLTLDAPEVATVLFQAGVLPSGGKVVVNFAIDPHTLTFDKGEDGSQHASLSCVVWAFSGKGDPQRSEGSLKADLKADVYAQMMKAYLPCQRTLNLKPGKYTLKLGVMDRITNHMGTITTEVAVP